MISIKSKDLKAIDLYRELPPARRLDYIGIGALLPSCAYIGFTYGGGLLGAAVGSVLAGVAFVLALLFSYWMVEVKCFLRYQRVASLEDADICKVTPIGSHKGPKGTCELKRRTVQVPGSEVQATETYFDHFRQQFVLDPTTGSFTKIGYKTKGTFASYLQTSGYGKQVHVDAARARWGDNSVEVPVPEFLQLLKGQMLAPFFVFQVFCVGLWCLDEYWHYSIFTLFMLIMFECTVVKSRQRNLQELRQMPHDPESLPVHRGGKWEMLTGTDLLPGDVVSLARLEEFPGGVGGGERVIPADCVVVSGSCIANEAMLTGESTPQWKVAVKDRAPNEVLSVKKDARHVVFNGTKLLLATPDPSGRLKSPDGGCIAVVLRTGFGTSQGKLMRTMLFSAEQVTANSLETGLFILFLLVFAVASSGYVLYMGLQDTSRSRYKLLLNCTMIITSVIPPELPMELSIAVNNSLLALSKQGVFCTEPFRIPFAGKVDVCCFDKTGTLTSDNMVFEGVARGGAGAGAELVNDLSELDGMVARVLAACQSLVEVGGRLVGDPLERAALTAIEWQPVGEHTMVPKPSAADAPGDPPREVVKIVHRHAFSSDLKRMSVVASLDAAGAGAAAGGGGGDRELSHWVLTKGAPEVVGERLARRPPGYDEGYKKYAAEGKRVIALAYKRLPLTETQGPDALKRIPREEIEQGLEFAGFAVFMCPLKAESQPALAALRESSHELVMITGDAALTACHVAQRVHILQRPVLILSHRHGHEARELAGGAGGGAKVTQDGDFEWVSPDEAVHVPFSPAAVDDLAREYDLCVAGDALAHLTRNGVAGAVVPRVQVFARTAPEQKELVVEALRAAGRTVLMCGDGTNDVGGLKAAHIGVALLSGPPGAFGKRSKRAAQFSDRRKKKSSSSSKDKGKEKGDRKERREKKGKKGDANSTEAAEGAEGAATGAGGEGEGEGGGGGGGEGAVIAGPPPAGEREEKDEKEEARRRRKEKREKQKANEGRMQSWLEKLESEEGAGVVRLGDASMAAPFTAKDNSVGPCTHLVRQGRSAMVTTIQMYKILGLNCLVSAYVMSVLNLKGVKLGDTQATAAGLIIAGLFLFISKAKPLDQLSPQRPHTTIFSLYAFASMLGQFAVHLTFLITAVSMAEAHTPKAFVLRPHPDDDFAPNIVNTVSFMVNSLIQVVTFAVNYVGAPFNEGLLQNRSLVYSLCFSGAALLIIITDSMRDLNEYLELVPLPEDFLVPFLGMAAADGEVAMKRLLMLVEMARQGGGGGADSIITLQRWAEYLGMD